MFRSTLICIARDEAREIEEWVHYHRGIGFDRVVLYDHMSNDGTATIAERAGAAVIQWREQVSWQAKAYTHSLETFGGDTEWISFLDSDEFFVPTADGCVGGFLDRIEPFVGVAVPWRCYGSGGHIDFPATPVTRAFTKRAPDTYSANRHTKVFVRAARTASFVNPHYMALHDADYVHPDGCRVDWQKPGKTRAPVDASIARINHYQVRSRAHYEEKLTRLTMKGLVREDRWHTIDLNDVDDPIIPIQFSHIALNDPGLVSSGRIVEPGQGRLSPNPLTAAFTTVIAPSMRTQSGFDPAKARQVSGASRLAARHSRPT